MNMNKISNKIRVLVADDHDIVRYGICSVLNSSRDVEVIGEASTGQEAFEKYEQLLPDVILLDISMPDMNGIDATRTITSKYPGAKVLILTMHLNEEYLNQVLNAGAIGYLLKNADIEEMLSGIRSVAEGRQVFSGDIAKLMTEKYIRSAQIGYEGKPVGKPRLTRRETEILQQIAEGKTSQEIAEILFISPRTVDTHRANLIQKLGVKNSAGLVRYAIEQNLLGNQDS
jgi:DNA-binding NarL/FixJ family response regulator